MTTAIAAIFVFFIVVIFHEFGHFAVAKFVGIKVHEFSIGMGPSILKKKKGETEYSLRILPIGGYVKMEGEDEHSDDIRSFSNKPISARIAVIVAGAFMNFVLALIIFCITSYFIGMPTTTIEKVIKDNPAYKAGLQSGDKVIGVNGIEINSWEEFRNIISSSSNNKVKISVIRNNQQKDFIVYPKLDKDTNRIVIGVISKTESSFISSIKNGFKNMIYVLKMILQFFGMLFTGNVKSGDVAGPIGIIHMVGQAAQYGFIPVLNFAGLISVNLGVFNLLPIPALDGSRLLFLIAELVRGKPINPEKEGLIHFIGFIFLLLLMVVVAYKDLIRLNIF